MAAAKKDFSKIIHLDKQVHNKLKMFVTEKQIDGVKTSLSTEAEKAILNHLKKNKAV
ncbi:MAG: hypothetical protein U5K00_02265 [Melioribacteraceae bacterium]|nr:hypothetical protein [Melioribacteraceae bacterium]